MDGGPGDDTVLGGTGDDDLIAGTGRDQLYGDKGADTLGAVDPNGPLADLLDGGADFDVCRADPQDDLRSCALMPPGPPTVPAPTPPPENAPAPGSPSTTTTTTTAPPPSSPVPAPSGEPPRHEP
jgi:Ca2+-binding RTX toxin-like protein